MNEWFRYDIPTATRDDAIPHYTTTSIKHEQVSTQLCDAHTWYPSAKYDQVISPMTWYQVLHVTKWSANRMISSLHRRFCSIMGTRSVVPDVVPGSLNFHVSLNVWKKISFAKNSLKGSSCKRFTRYQFSQNLLLHPSSYLLIAQVPLCTKDSMKQSQPLLEWFW